MLFNDGCLRWAFFCSWALHIPLGNTWDDADLSSAHLIYRHGVYQRAQGPWQRNKGSSLCQILRCLPSSVFLSSHTWFKVLLVGWRFTQSMLIIKPYRVGEPSSFWSTVTFDLTHFSLYPHQRVNERIGHVIRWFVLFFLLWVAFMNFQQRRMRLVRERSGILPLLLGINKSLSVHTNVTELLKAAVINQVCHGDTSSASATPECRHNKLQG